MTFQPVVPLGGLPGWVFLNATLGQQTNAFDKSPEIVRDTEYFEQNIGNVASAEELVGDRRLLRVALSAFGLQDDLNARALIQRVLEEDVNDTDALANRLADERYKQLTSTFQFSNTAGPATQREGFGQEITALYRRRQFEVAVGDSSESLRLAMNASRELADIATGSGSDDTKWFRILGTPPLREVLETALGLPSQFALLDLDRQLETLKARAAGQLDINSPEDLADDALREDLVQRYLLQDQIAAVPVQSSAAIALALLQS